MSRRSLGYHSDATYTQDVCINPETGTNSAKLAAAEREIKRLREENQTLKRDLSETSLLYKQLMYEESQEQFDERRVNLLKAQLLQLERQVLSMSEALSSRSFVMMEVENNLSAIADLCRSYAEADGAIGEVKVKRQDLRSVVERAESSRIKLYKAVEVTPERLARPIMMMNQYVKPSCQERVTWLDVCSGKLEHLNLRQVGKIESELVGVYKNLLSLQQCLAPLVVPGSTTVNREVPEEVFHKLSNQTEICADMVRQASQNLLQLSLLLPSAPWPRLQKFSLEACTVDDVVSCLPGFQKSKLADVRITIEALLKASAYERMMLSQEVKLLKQELSFHNSVYQLQQSYMQTVFTALRESLASFEKEMWDVLGNPLEDILKSYKLLENTTDERALKRFVSSFKDNSMQVTDAVEKLKTTIERSDGQDVLSEFGNEFFKQLSASQQSAMESRDKLIAELDEVKTQRSEALKQLQILIESRRQEEANVTEKTESNISPDISNISSKAQAKSSTVKTSPLQESGKFKVKKAEYAAVETSENSEKVIIDASKKKKVPTATLR